eukprot:gene29089-32851_t
MLLPGPEAQQLATYTGWLIECSAMSTRYLGALFDIHIGGEDHIPVHHTNEIAQHEACHNHPPARYWLHGAFLKLEGSDKMSKSDGSFLRLDAVVERGYDPLAYRYLALSAHYRSPLSFSWDALDAAHTALGRLRQAYHRLPDGGQPDPDYRQAMLADLNQDLNTARVLARMWELVKSPLAGAAQKATINWVDQVLGLGLDGWTPASHAVPESVQQLVAARDLARLEKRWADADAARTDIAAAGTHRGAPVARPAPLPIGRAGAPPARARGNLLAQLRVHFLRHGRGGSLAGADRPYRLVSQHNLAHGCRFQHIQHRPGRRSHMHGRVAIPVLAAAAAHAQRRSRLNGGQHLVAELFYDRLHVAPIMWLRLKTRQIRVRQQACRHAHLAELRAAVQGGDGLVRIEQHGRIEGALHAEEGLQLGRLELHAHGIDLLDPHAMLARDGAANLHAQRPDLGAESLGAPQRSRLVCIEQDQR